MFNLLHRVIADEEPTNVGVDYVETRLRLSIQRQQCVNICIRVGRPFSNVAKYWRSVVE
jgi:hypothetical protein